MFYHIKNTLFVIILFTWLPLYGQPSVAQASDAKQEPNLLSSIVTLQGYYVRNLGVFSETWSRAVGGYVAYGIYFPEHLMLLLQAGYTRFELREDEIPNRDVDLIALPVLAGVRYYFMTQSIRPYSNIATGFTINTQKGPSPEGITSITSADFAFQIGWGLSVDLVGNLELDLAVKYNSHWRKPYNMTGFEYGAGFAWKIGE